MCSRVAPVARWRFTLFRFVVILTVFTLSPLSLIKAPVPAYESLFCVLAWWLNCYLLWRFYLLLTFSVSVDSRFSVHCLIMSPRARTLMDKMLAARLREKL